MFAENDTFLNCTGETTFWPLLYLSLNNVAVNVMYKNYPFNKFSK